MNVYTRLCKLRRATHANYATFEKKKRKEGEKKPTFSFTPMEHHQIYKTRFRNFMNCNYLDHAGVEFVKMQIWNPVKYWHGYSWWKIQRSDSLFEFSYGKWLEFARVKLYRYFIASYLSLSFLVFLLLPLSSWLKIITRYFE